MSVCGEEVDHSSVCRRARFFRYIDVIMMAMSRLGHNQ
jgi:hypothetical protein